MMKKLLNLRQDDGVSFGQWMGAVDSVCMSIIGVAASDMEDYFWRDDYENGGSVFEALEGALEYWSEDAMFGGLVDDAFDELNRMMKQEKEG